jgi:spermidine/putrescine transport system permease protein
MMNSKIHFSRNQLCIPYGLFLICFVAAPLVVIISYAFTNGEGKISLENFIGFFTSPNTIGTLAYSFAIAVVTTCVCLCLAYPIAYILARSDMKHKPVILLMFIMPMWINFTLRITALKEILTIIEGNLAFHPFLNTIIGMTYDFLPFMILPIYTTLLKLDKSLLEAASDLGADSLHVFLKVTLPLSVPGIISGIVMVFLPSMTNYVVLDMLYNSTYIMGSLIGAYFSAYDWHNGSMIALILLVIILVFTLFTDRYSDDDSSREVELNDKKSM